MDDYQLSSDLACTLTADCKRGLVTSLSQSGTHPLTIALSGPASPGLKHHFPQVWGLSTWTGGICSKHPGKSLSKVYDEDIRLENSPLQQQVEFRTQLMNDKFSTAKHSPDFANFYVGAICNIRVQTSNRRATQVVPNVSNKLCKQSFISILFAYCVYVSVTSMLLIISQNSLNLWEIITS